MKKIIGIVAVALSTVTILYAQEKKEKQATPTAEAKAGFEKEFPGATNIKWEKGNADFEVNFRQNGTEISAVFEKNGSLKETETQISVSELPASATAYIKQHYTGQKVKEAAKIVKAGGTVNYEAEISRKDILFDASGNFLREAKD